MENFILIVLAIFIGYLFRKLRIFQEEAAAILNRFVIFISLPAMILLQIPKLMLSMDIMIPVIIAWVVMSLTALLTLFISNRFHFSREVTGALMLVAVLTNSSFLGIPVINAYLGDEALPYILVYDQMGTFLALATYGIFVTAYYSNKSEINVQIMAVKILTFPPFISLVIALFFIGTPFPEEILKVLETLANTIVPLALVAVGLQLQLKLPGHEIKPFGIALFIKLVIAPLIALVVVSMAGWSNLAASVSVMEAGMAPMVTAGAMASLSGLAPRLSSAIVGYGILFSFFTTALLFKLL
ncbi:AEC family transporter [Sulfurovum sp. XTW-4]|uniref:AEC family transporter n=1 Tax=Sulfurovum xiamenensis TaxID=3019066 RepID=A0ABT7QQ87_9BACT|nr:AEC family transporter [Sulfurovum xiamenensis]MDM5262729.1 AEC family transporter [Sulfurovum xiamenensis]